MGNPKQKWTAEEEEALKAGIAKHGTGKWKLIQKDPEFHQFLHARSNIDLKDKWRNMSAANPASRDKIRTPRPKPIQDAPAPPSAPTPIPPVFPIAHEPVTEHVKEEPVRDFSDGKNGPGYNDMIFQALSGVNEQCGLDLGSIYNYMEQRINTEQLSQNFRKQLGARLRRLVQQEKLEKVDNCYRLKSKSKLEANSYSGNRKDTWSSRQQLTTAHFKAGESLEEAAKTAAYKVAEAEEKSFYAALSVKDAERLSKMAEETDCMLQLAREIYDKCHIPSGGVVLVA